MGFDRDEAVRLNEAHWMEGRRGRKDWGERCPERMLRRDREDERAMCEMMLEMEDLRDWMGSGQRCKRVLDVGCGEGRARGELLRRFGGEYFGIELLEGKGGGEGVHRYALEEVPEEWGGLFDVIWANHVMEHCLDAVEGMGRIGTLLAPVGIFGMVVPGLLDDVEPAHVSVMGSEDWLRVMRGAGLVPLHVRWLRRGIVELRIIAVRREDYPRG